MRPYYIKFIYSDGRTAGLVTEAVDALHAREKAAKHWFNIGAQERVVTLFEKASA